MPPQVWILNNVLISFMHFKFPVDLCFIRKITKMLYIGKIFMLVDSTLFLNYISECCTAPGRTKNLAYSLHSGGG